MKKAVAIAFTLSALPFISYAYSYPKVSPNSYYLLPPQVLTLSGTQFAPYEAITISGPSGTMHLNASASGTFFTPITSIPFSWQNSKRVFSITSAQSAYTIPLTIKIGTYYPQIEPSTYFASYAELMSVSGRGFAPNEWVKFSVNGLTLAERQANATGAVNLSFYAPASGLLFNLSAVGLSSGKGSSRVITLH